jgi:hypothetical protein
VFPPRPCPAYKLPATLPFSYWNCTEKRNFKDADFIGKVNSQTVCKVGDCCKFSIGIYARSDDYASNHKTLAERSSAALCEDIPEESYCSLVTDHVQLNCIEFYIAPNERMTVWPCYDTLVLYYLSCKVYKEVFTPWKQHEAPLYVERSTVEEQLVLDCVTTHQDRMCNPYSYFHPATVSDSNPEQSSTPVASWGSLSNAVLAICVLFLS